MELLIPGLILVALMVYASTRIKNRAAAAFDPELIETERYSLRKPEGFLHVVGNPEHEVMAYSKEYGDEGHSVYRQATIELDILDGDLQNEVESVKSSAVRFEERSDARGECVIESDESANESNFKVIYKLIDSGSAVFRLRFAVLAEHFDAYVRRIDETLDSFTVKQHL